MSMPITPSTHCWRCCWRARWDPQRTRWYVGRVLFWTTLLGIGDELLQYLWITTSYSEYLDFNDFLTNLVAAAAGLLLYYGTAATRLPTAAYRKPVVELLTAGAILLLVLVGFQTGSLAYSPAEKVPPGGIAQLADGSRRLYLQRGPDFYGSWPIGPRHGHYFVMPPTPALLLMVLAGLAFASYQNARSTSADAGSLLLGRKERTERSGESLVRFP